MTPAKATAAWPRRGTDQGLQGDRQDTALEWNHFFGGTALLLGLLMLLGDVPIAFVGTLAAVVFVVTGAFCAVRHHQTVGVAALGLGLVLLLPLSGLDAASLHIYRILVGAVLGVFGIVKLT